MNDQLCVDIKVTTYWGIVKVALEVYNSTTIPLQTLTLLVIDRLYKELPHTSAPYIISSLYGFCNFIYIKWHGLHCTW